MRQIILIVLVMIFETAVTIPALAESSSAPQTIATVPGTFRSMIGMPDGSFFLLSESGLTMVLPTGKVQPVAFPPLPDPEKVTDWSDIAVFGNQLLLTRFGTPKLYFFDLLPKPKWTVLPIAGLTSKRPNLAEIRVLQKKIFVLDAGGGVFEIDLMGKAFPAVGKVLPITAPDGSLILFTPPKSGQEKMTWAISDVKGRKLLDRTDPGNGVHIQDLRILGFDTKGRMVVLEILGKGELASQHFVFAVKAGKPLPPLQTPSQALNPMIRSHVLSPEGDVVFLAPGKEGQVILQKLSIP